MVALLQSGDNVPVLAIPGPLYVCQGASAHLTMSGTRSACRWTQVKVKLLVLSSRHCSRVDGFVGFAKSWQVYSE